MVDINRLLKRPEFPRSEKYEPEWMMDNQMGPNALWLMEWLCEALEMKPGMHVLDLACGKAMSSIFLAREFGARVWAADLWISPGPNWQRVIQAGVADLVCPLKAEAHNLPFAPGFFHALVSVDAFQYFGTDELYIDYLSQFVKPGGELSVIVVGLTKEIGANPPACLTEPQSNGKAFWDPSNRCFKTKEFWQNLWSGSPMLTDVTAEIQPDGWRHWRDFELAVEAAGKGIFPSDAEALDKDRGETVCFIRLTARRTEEMVVDLYDPALGAKVGVDR